MRPSLPPDMGDNAAAQATLESRLRREQVKRVSQMEDLSNWSGNATDGQVAKYTQATGTWGPGTGGIQGDRATFVPTVTNESVASGGFYNQALTSLGDMTETSIGLSGDTTHVQINTAGIYLFYAQVGWAANSTGSRNIQIMTVGNGDPDSATAQYETDIPATAAGNMYVSMSAMFFMTVSGSIPDTIGVSIRQTSGGPLVVQNHTFIRVLRLL